MTTLIDAPTQAIAALRGEEPELTLFWFEETKADLDFDPQAPGPQIEDPDEWNLEQEHPLSIVEQIRALGLHLGEGDATGFLYRQEQLFEFMARMDRERQAGFDDGIRAWEQELMQEADND